MKTKNILGLVAFFVAFIVSTGLVILFVPFTPIDPSIVTVQTRYNSGTAFNIANLIRQDVQNGSERNELVFTNGGHESADDVADYVEQSMSIDDTSLPSDFQSAWRRHMAAWQDYSDFLRDMENPDVRKNMNDATVYRMSVEHTAKINSSWLKVLATGKRYGANIPKEAY